MRSLLLVISFLLYAVSAFAQQRVKVSNDDPKWGETISVSYTAPATSVYAKPDYRDTVYCAVNVTGAKPEHWLILPMRRASAQQYETSLVVPDSTNSLWVDISMPRDRLPDGITTFTCRTAEGKPAPGALIETNDNIDSAFEAELTLYPQHYGAYLQLYDAINRDIAAGVRSMTLEERRASLRSLIERLTKEPNGMGRNLTLAALEMRAGNDSEADSWISQALAVGGDPMLNDAKFWNQFFTRRLVKGNIVEPRVQARALASLAEKYPHSPFAAKWLLAIAFDTLTPVTSFQRVAAAWAGSNDVDLLLSIAHAYGYTKSSLYDPSTAMIWLNHAEDAWRTAAGFYSGENIYGSMSGRFGQIASLKVTLLAAAGKVDEAVGVATQSMKTAEDQYDKQTIAEALGKAYLDAGRIESAKRAYGERLALGTGGYIDGLKELYEKTKLKGESEEDFAKRLAKQYGSTVSLPTVPNFDFTTIDGWSNSLKALRGKVVVLDCWFTTCGGCAIEKKSLNQLVDSYAADSNVVFLSVALDDEKTIRNYLNRTPFKFKIVPDGQDICESLGVSGYPTHIILDRNGKTLGFELGGAANQGELMRPKIEEALAKD